MRPSDHATDAAPLAFAIVNARVWTRDARRPWVDAVLTRGATIVAVGATAEVRKRAGERATVIDAGGRMVVPLDADGRLAAGEPADVAIVERVAGASPPVASDGEDLAFVLEKGRVVVDRLAR